MNEEILNATNEEVVQPQYDNNGAENDTTVSQEVTAPEYNEMSDDDFENYIDSVQGSSDKDEVQVDDVSKTNTGITEPANVEEKPFKSFATQREYQGEIDRIIGERLKKNRESMNTLDGLKELSLNFYGGNDGDNALAQLIADLQSQNADRKGISVEDYKQQTQNSIDARKYREQQRLSDRETQIAQIRHRWQAESEGLKKVVPDFDFAKAMQNRAFYNNIVNGMSVSNAYLSASKQSDMPSSARQRRGIFQNGTMNSSNIGRVEANPESMTDGDFMKYINRIKG